ncbi:MAG: protein-L-isoaspartate O-methyltransferase [Roseiarcus sp.]|jgi:protein-L-isoaspartate(D-aspartate) O-methyltransferase
MAQTISADEWAVRRRHMVEGQLRACDVTDLAVLAAFGRIPREAFVAPAFASLAYADRQIPALGAHGRALLAPMVLARLVQAAGVRAGDRALDVAGGSGYGAMILAALGAEVVALESDADAAAQAKALTAGAAGVASVVGDFATPAPGGPFDLILVNGAFGRSPDELLDQLAAGGRLVGVDSSLGAPKAVLIERVGGVASRRVLFDAAAPNLEAFSPHPSFAF